MTGKDKRFPLTLSSVVDKASGVTRGGPSPAMRIATPQTATQNAAQHVIARISAQPDTPAHPAQRSAPVPVTSGLAAPLVSDGVRSAMVARVAKQGVKDSKVLAAM